MGRFPRISSESKERTRARTYTHTHIYTHTNTQGLQAQTPEGGLSRELPETIKTPNVSSSTPTLPHFVPSGLCSLKTTGLGRWALDPPSLTPPGHGGEDHPASLSFGFPAPNRGSISQFTLDIYLWARGHQIMLLLPCDNWGRLLASLSLTHTGAPAAQASSPALTPGHANRSSQPWVLSRSLPSGGHGPL